jgi:hypothetical protein
MTNQKRWSAGLALAGFVGLCCYAGSDAQAKKDAEKVELSGPVKNVRGTCPNIEFEIAGTKVKTSSRTEFDDDCRKVADGKRVEVEGKLRGDKEVMAKEVEIN